MSYEHRGLNQSTLYKERTMSLLKKVVFNSCLSLVAFSSVADAKDVNIKNYDQKVEKKILKDEKLDKDIFKILLKTRETIATGNDALESLKKNRDFIDRLKDPKFQECVAFKVNKDAHMRNKELAKDALVNGEISQKAYENFAIEMDSKMSKLENKLRREKCYKGGLL